MEGSVELVTAALETIAHAPRPSRLKTPRDPNQLGKLIVDISVGEVEEAAPPDDGKNKAAQELGRMGGKARAENLSARKRKEIARKAAQARWK